MQLRDQPILDKFQDDIFRLPLDSRLVILGPPGTGKTTTLVRRLRQKIDFQFLEEDEQVLVEDGAAPGLPHAQSWLMFTPTELLKQYVREAFAREGVAAPEQRIRVWSDHRRDLARRELPILRSASGGTMVLNERAEALLPGTIVDQIGWFEDFDGFQAKAFVAQIMGHADTVAQSSDEAVARLGSRASGLLVSASDRPIAAIVALSGLFDDLRRSAAAMSAEIQQQLRRPLARLAGADPMLRRRRALMEASPHALDPDVEVAGERPVGELTAPISLDEDQDRDQPRRVAGGPQRLLNRVARYPGDQGLVWPAVVYALVVLLIAYLQYDLRAISSVAASVASMPFDAGAIEVTAKLGGGVDPTMGVANVFFVLIFLATQLFAVSEGMKHHFLGQDGERAYRITRGVDTYEALTRRYDARVRAADEALSALLTGFERYSVKPDRALFRARVAREGAAATSPEGGLPSTPAEAMAANSNVSPIAGAAGAA